MGEISYWSTDMLDLFGNLLSTSSMEQFYLSTYDLPLLLLLVDKDSTNLGLRSDPGDMEDTSDSCSFFFCWL
jgi:hypothetical protein